MAETELERNAIDAKNHADREEFLRAVDTQWLNSHIPGAAMSRCLALIQQERDIEKANQEKTDHAAVINSRAEHELALAREVELEKRRVASEVARRQFLRDNDETLKTLRKKLTAGYVCRDVRKQILDKEYKKRQEKLEDQYNDAIMTKSMAKDQEIDQREEKEDRERKTQYRIELRAQMQNNQGTKAYEAKVKIEEKRLMDEMQKKYAEEDRRALEEIRDRKARLWCEMLSCQESRAAWRKDGLEDMADIMRRVKREQAEMEAKGNTLKAERDAKRAAKEAVVRGVAEKNLAAALAKQAREDMIRELREQEEYERNVQLDIVEREKEIAMIVSNKTALEMQMMFKKQAREKEKEMDKCYRNEVIEKVAKEDEKERMKEENRRAKIKQYAAELKMQMELNSKIRQAEQEDLDARNKFACGGDAEKNEQIAAERARLIEDHAPYVLGCLQAGVIHHCDLPSVRRGADKHPQLKPLDIEAMGRGEKSVQRPKCNAQCLVIREY